MFKITENQFTAMKVNAADRFHTRLCDYIMAEFKVPAAKRPEIEEGMTAAIADARAFGLKSEKAVATYGVVAFLVGLGIKDDPKLSAAMASPTLSEPKKIEWLHDWLAALEKALETPAHG